MIERTRTKGVSDQILLKSGGKHLYLLLHQRLVDSLDNMMWFSVRVQLNLLLNSFEESLAGGHMILSTHAKPFLNLNQLNNHNVQWMKIWFDNQINTTLN